ncbi:MAG: molybdate ABC transporter substrate-binding protein [Chloroflexota bacterium]
MCPRNVRGPHGRGVFRAHCLLAALALVAGCGPSPAPGQVTTLTVYGAASLGPALESIKSAYLARSGVDLLLSTGSSATLRTQIEQGAPADVFLSADLQSPTALVAGGLVDGQVVVFAGNRLAVIVPSDNPGNLSSPLDLGRPGVRVVAAADRVPITTYATSLLERLAAIPGAPPDFAVRYAANMVSREPDVAAVMARIELGEGDVAIVYASDVARATNVRVLSLPEGRNVSVAYGGVVIAAPGHVAAGHALLDWLAGTEGQAILARFGFSTVP